MLFNFCVNEIDGTVGIFVRSHINLKHFKSHFDENVIFVKLCGLCFCAVPLAGEKV